MTQRSAYQTHAAAGLKGLGGVHVYISNCGLPKQLIDLVYLRTSQINGCAYCIDMHTADLRKGGMPVEKLMLVSAWREPAAISRSRSARRWRGPSRSPTSPRRTPRTPTIRRQPRNSARRSWRISPSRSR